MTVSQRPRAAGSTRTALTELNPVRPQRPGELNPARPAGTTPSQKSTVEALTRRSNGTRTAELLMRAWDFLDMYHREARDHTSLRQRWAAVSREISETGTYRHTRAELIFGARAAWRHSVRCVGRVRWPSLVVRDARHVTGAKQVYRELVRHLRFATNGGRVRSTITVFAPDDWLGPRVRIWNEQLVRYAGWRQPDGSVLGDPRNAGFTELAMRFGWRPPSRVGQWDLLPWIIETEHEDPRAYAVPPRAVLEVPITHPEYGWFGELGLRWHAVPAISHMRLQIGGIDYSAAPFNGFYLGDEIGSRNLSDGDRYDQVAAVARGMGLTLGSDRTLWRDRAVVELNRAVLHSFDTAGVTIADHHSEARHFMRFAAKEEEVGRCPYADWAWINSHPVPPQTPTFHRLWTNVEVQPNFWLDPECRDRALGEFVPPTLRDLRRT
jgi:nitric-oxide synthase, bacterial